MKGVDRGVPQEKDGCGSILLSKTSYGVLEAGSCRTREGCRRAPRLTV